MVEKGSGSDQGGQVGRGLFGDGGVGAEDGAGQVFPVGAAGQGGDSDQAQQGLACGGGGGAVGVGAGAEDQGGVVAADEEQVLAVFGVELGGDGLGEGGGGAEPAFFGAGAVQVEQGAEQGGVVVEEGGDFDLVVFGDAFEVAAFVAQGGKGEVCQAFGQI